MENTTEIFLVDKAIKDNELQRRMLLAENARLLQGLLDTKRYKVLIGDEEAPWGAYLAQIEVFYTRSRVHNLLRVYKKYVLELNLDPQEFLAVPMSRLIELLPIVTKDNQEDWLAKAQFLLSKDWKIELRKAKGQITSEDEHEHDYQNYEICKVCGEKHRHETNKQSE